MIATYGIVPQMSYRKFPICGVDKFCREVVKNMYILQNICQNMVSFIHTVFNGFLFGRVQFIIIKLTPLLKPVYVSFEFIKFKPTILTSILYDQSTISPTPSHSTRFLFPLLFISSILAILCSRITIQDNCSLFC